MLYVQYTKKNFSSSTSPVPPFIIAIFSTMHAHIVHFPHKLLDYIADSVQ